MELIVGILILIGIIWFFKKRNERQHANRANDSTFIFTTSFNAGQTISTHIFEVDKPSVEVHGMTLPDPLFYRTKKADGDVLIEGAIDESLPISKTSTFTPALPYYPNYATSSPEQRYRFLEWLRDGRSSDVEIGYVFMFFYGLEHRILQKKNRQKIRNELRRLMTVYSENRSFQSYATQLLVFDALDELSKLQEDQLIEAFPARAGEPMHPSSRSARLAWYAMFQNPVPADLIYRVIRVTTASRSVVERRVDNELRLLFENRYKQQYGDGVLVHADSRSVIEYHPGSLQLRRELELLERTDILKKVSYNSIENSDVFTPLRTLYAECVDDLRNYSRAVGRADSDELTPMLWEQLPDDLKNVIPHPHKEAWVTLLEQSSSSPSPTIIPVKKIAKLCAVLPSKAISNRNTELIINTAQSLGFTIDPNPQDLPHKWNWEENVSVLYTPANADKETGDYVPAKFAAFLVMFVANGKSTIPSSFISSATKHLSRDFGLGEFQTKRLTGLLQALEGVEADMRGVTSYKERNLVNSDILQIRESVTNIMTELTPVRGDAANYLRRVSNALGLAPEELQEAVVRINGEYGRELEAPVQYNNSSQTEAGEPIPPPPTNTTAPSRAEVILDPERLKQLQQETEAVAELLNNEFSDNVDTVDAQPESERFLLKNSAPSPRSSIDHKLESRSSIFDTLDARYRPFATAIVQQNVWTETELKTLAQEHDIMLNGAISVINEWADEHHGDFLIEDGNPYEIYIGILKAGAQK